MEITIKNKVYKLKYTLRALFIFESITNKMFDIKTLTDEYLFFYCLIMANNKDASLTFEELIEELDENDELMEQYQKFMADEILKNKQFDNEPVKDGEKKKH